MSQKAIIVSVKHVGAAQLVRGRYTRDPMAILTWISDAYRARFNDCRAHRPTHRYRWVTDDYGEQVRRYASLPTDDYGDKVFARHYTPLGGSHLEPNKPRSGAQWNADNPWAAGISKIVNQATYDENKEWQAAFKRKATAGGHLPEFRSARDGVKFAGESAQAITYRPVSDGSRNHLVDVHGGGRLKRNKWTLRLRVRASEPIRETKTIRVNITRGEVVFVNTPEPVDTPTSRTDVVGVDLGVAHTITTSDGRTFDAPTLTDAEAAELLHLRRKASRQWRTTADRQGKAAANASRRRKDTLAAIARIQGRQNRRMDAFAHTVSAELVKSARVIVFEDLDVPRMTRRAHDSGVSAKRALNRAILAQSWGRVRQYTEYKAPLTGGAVVRVDPAYTSQTCHECGHVDAASRPDQATFCCTACGHRDNADRNAALNIADRGAAALAKA